MGHIINFAVIHVKPETIILLFDQDGGGGGGGGGQARPRDYLKAHS